jgi:hypothetical protein
VDRCGGWPNQDRWLAQQGLDVAEQVPVRGTNRLKSLTIAVAPLQNTMDAAALERLTQALMFLCDVEALVVDRDALPPSSSQRRSINPPINRIQRSWGVCRNPFERHGL